MKTLMTVFKNQKPKFILYLLLTSLLTISLKAQTPEIDSLENLLHLHKNQDTIKVNLLNETASKLRRVDIDKTLKYAEEAGELADKIDFTKGKAKSLRIIGKYYKYKSDFPKALEYYQKSLKIKEELGDKLGASDSFIDIGIIYKLQNDYPKALEYYQKSLKIREELGYKSGISVAYNNIGNIYWQQGDYLKALEYHQKSLKIKEELGDKSGISVAYNNIGNIYWNQGNYPKALEYYQKSIITFEELGNKKNIPVAYNNIGTIYTNQGDYLKALEYLQKSMKIYKELGDKKAISRCYINIGLVYLRQVDYPKALEYLQKSMKINEKLDNKIEISTCYNNIGSIYKNQGDYPKALEYLQKSLRISIEIGYKRMEAVTYEELGSLYLVQKKTKEAYHYSKKAYTLAVEIEETDLIKESSEILAKSCEAMGLYKDAYKYYVVFKTMNDSLYNKENIKKIAALEYQYKYDKEKQAIELEQQKKDAILAEEARLQKTVRNSFIVGLVLMALLVLVVLRSFLQKKVANRILSFNKREIEGKNEKLKQINAEKDKLFSIISHDLRSPFNSLLGFSGILLKNHKEFDEEKRENQIKLINSSSKIAFNLLENLLTWSRSQLGGIELSPQEIDIKTLINEIILLSQPTAKNKSISLIDNTEDDISVYADINMINTILRNLITNAIKFTHKKGTVLISANKTKKQDFIEITVTDTGVGISKDRIDDLFRIDKNTGTSGTERERGTGLGLIICKEFVEKHGGKIWVESSLNKGSSFKFMLPVKQ